MYPQKSEFSNIFDAPGKDKVYCAIKNKINPHCQEANAFIAMLWEIAHKYIDSNIPEKLPVEFHKRFWEIYLAASLIDSSLTLQNSSGPDGPDICVNAGDGLKIWVEAVTVSSGDGIDSVKEAEPGSARSVPDDQIKLRLLNAFDTKSKEYKNYREKNWVSSADPYIIAINAAQVHSASHELEIPRIVRSLLPFGFQTLHLNREAEIDSSIYEYQGEVIKVSGTAIKTTSFMNPEYSGISAVIYSCADVFNHPSEISNSLLLFHNPLAENPIGLSFLKKGQEYWVDHHLLKSKNWNQY